MSSSTENDGTAEASTPQGNGNSFDIQTFTVSVSYVYVRKNNDNKKDLILSVKELCSLIAELVTSYTARCVNAFTPLKAW